jgi:hypothetical protein
VATDKAALGRKYTCFSCGCKFYDLNHEIAACPRCEADQADDPNPPLDPALLFRQPRGSRKKKITTGPPPTPKPEPKPEPEPEPIPAPESNAGTESDATEEKES